MEIRPTRKQLTMVMVKEWTYDEWKQLFATEIRDSDSLTMWLRARLPRLDKWFISKKVLGYLIAWFRANDGKKTVKRLQKLLIARDNWTLYKDETLGLLQLNRQDGVQPIEEDKEEDKMDN